MALAVMLAAAPAVSDDGWQDAPEYIRLFAPAAHRAAYRASVSPAALDAVLTAAADDPSRLRAPGAWTAQPQYVLDAFGRSGIYDRWALARLFGAQQPRVARGARIEAGRVVESWTLVSPYPSPDFARLEPGTLRIILGIAP